MLHTHCQAGGGRRKRKCTLITPWRRGWGAAPARKPIGKPFTPFYAQDSFFCFICIRLSFNSFAQEQAAPPAPSGAHIIIEMARAPRGQGQGRDRRLRNNEPGLGSSIDRTRRRSTLAENAIPILSDWIFQIVPSHPSRLVHNTLILLTVRVS